MEKKISERNRRTRATAPTHPDEPTAHRSAQARPQKPRTQPNNLFGVRKRAWMAVDAGAKTVLSLRCSVREGEMDSQKHDKTVESPHMYSKDEVGMVVRASSVGPF